MKVSTANVLATGVVAGVIGFATTAVGFVVLDLVTGRGFGFTPSLLGNALFSDVRQACDVQISGTSMAAYSAAHLLVFLLLGWLGAWLSRQPRHAHGSGWGRSSCPSS